MQLTKLLRLGGVNLNKAPTCFGHHHNHTSENPYFRFALSFYSLPHFSSLKHGFLSSEVTLSTTAAPGPAFPMSEQQRYSQTYSELPHHLLKGDLQQHQQEALSGQTFPFPDRW